MPDTLSDLLNKAKEEIKGKKDSALSENQASLEQFAKKLEEITRFIRYVERAMLAIDQINDKKLEKSVPLKELADVADKNGRVVLRELPELDFSRYVDAYGVLFRDDGYKGGVSGCLNDLGALKRQLPNSDSNTDYAAVRGLFKSLGQCNSSDTKQKIEAMGIDKLDLAAYIRLWDLFPKSSSWVSANDQKQGTIALIPGGKLAKKGAYHDYARVEISQNILNRHAQYLKGKEFKGNNCCYLVKPIRGAGSKSTILYYEDQGCPFGKIIRFNQTAKEQQNGVGKVLKLQVPEVIDLNKINVVHSINNGGTEEVKLMKDGKQFI